MQTTTFEITTDGTVTQDGHYYGHIPLFDLFTDFDTLQVMHYGQLCSWPFRGMEMKWNDSLDELIVAPQSPVPSYGTCPFCGRSKQDLIYQITEDGLPSDDESYNLCEQCWRSTIDPPETWAYRFTTEIDDE